MKKSWGGGGGGGEDHSTPLPIEMSNSESIARFIHQNDQLCDRAEIFSR